MINITERAASKIKEFAAQEKVEEYGLRVGVMGGGCSGLLYKLALDKGPRQDDRVVEQHGVKIFIDLKSAIYLTGTTLDYTEGLNGKGFTFQNPNASTTCGCGTSFSA
ncbi:MAG: iron-sulfur cluster insertion protein ErpA [Chloroflexi bacterium]|nr:iron-sulfur cluster insertion protein ErpA [Chloroflexota bacterium]